AAQDALRSLRQIDGREPTERARRTAAAVADYLRQRLGLRAAEPTPAEAEACLREHGVSRELAGQAAVLLRGCAAVRFEPEPPPHDELTDAASRLILALEAETWSA